MKISEDNDYIILQYEENIVAPRNNVFYKYKELEDDQEYSRASLKNLLRNLTLNPSSPSIIVLKWLLWYTHFFFSESETVNINTEGRNILNYKEKIDSED